MRHEYKHPIATVLFYQKSQHLCLDKKNQEKYVTEKSWADYQKSHCKGRAPDINDIENYYTELDLIILKKMSEKY